MNDHDEIYIHDVRPTRADALKNRELLIETAQRLFAQSGVDAVSMAQVAQAAGVGKGTLYRNFASKADLCQELLDTEMRALQARTLAYLRAEPDAWTKLAWFLRETATYVMRNLALLGGGILDGQPLDHPAHYWWRQTLRGLLVQINPTIDHDYTADLLYVLLDPRTLHYQLMAVGLTPERITDGLVTSAARLTR